MLLLLLQVLLLLQILQIPKGIRARARARARDARARFLLYARYTMLLVLLQILQNYL